MRTIDIYRSGSLFVTINPDSSSVQSKKVMGDNLINISFEDSRFLNFAINDYCVVFGEKYILTKLPQYTKISTYRHRYSLSMLAEGFELVRTQYMFYDSTNVLAESDFSLTGNADDFINLVLDNANRTGSGWTKGQVITSDYKTLTFSKENAYSALSKIAEAFSTEFWLTGKTIHLTYRSTDTGLAFKHGRGKGLYEITRNNLNDSDVVTRLYVYGSDKNLPQDYPGTRLRLPGMLPYIEQNTAKYGVIEYTDILDDIYPTRTGKITSVNVSDPFKFYDTSMDFDVNDYLLPGIVAKVAFNTGQLAGYSFDLSRYNNGTKEFTILQNRDERAIEVPSTAIRPDIGDEYKLIDMRMPTSYIVAAENRLQARAAALLDQLSQPQLSYNVVIDPVVMKNRNRSVNIGDLIWIIDTQLELQRKIRVVSITRNIVDEWAYQVELSDIVSPGTISLIISAQQSNSESIQGINQQLQNNSIFNNTVIGDLNIKQGSIIGKDLPTTNTTSGFSEILVENATGKLYRKV